MHIADLTAPEQRVLGALIEKRFTTPEQYPLTLNSLRLACNQSTNRDPVVAYDEHTVREAADRLTRYGVARMASGHTSRSIKYRHLAEEALGLGREQLAVLCVLLLRGPQTPGELKQRTERMATLPSLEAVEEVLGTLIDAGYARRVARQPGQKEDRFEQLLGGSGELAATGGGQASAAPAPSPGQGAGQGAPVSAGAPPSGAGQAPAAGLQPGPAAADSNGLEARVGALEEQVARLGAELRQLRELLE